MKAARDMGSGREEKEFPGILAGISARLPFSLSRASACALRRSAPGLGSSLAATSSASVEGGRISFTLAIRIMKY